MIRAIFLILLGLTALGILIFRSIQFSPELSSLPHATEALFHHSGDPINVAFVGAKKEIMSIFLEANWLVPDSIDKRSTEKIIIASLNNSSYPTAPISSVYLFGRRQDLAFELPTNTIKNRHHVRLWEANKVMYGKELWIGSSTYDSGIELSGTNAFPTHHISPNVDKERDFLVNSLQNTNLIQSFSKRSTYPVLWATNVNGDWYFDDGLVEVLVLK